MNVANFLNVVSGLNVASFWNVVYGVNGAGLAEQR